MTIQDLPRHLGQHSGGMVICQGQLDSVVPLEPATMPGRVVIQWDKEDCADMGIIKVDLLGLGMMAVLEESIQLIRDAYREEVDLAHLPQDDPLVYDALQKADTIGMFQVESRAQMSCLPRLRPERFYDIVVQVAIIRPGPIVGQMLNPFLRRRQGREKAECLHPSLEPVLARTLGVPLFQEQLLRMAMIVAGFHRRRSRRAAPRHGIQTLRSPHARHRNPAARRHDAQRHHRQAAGRHRPIHHFVRAVRISRIARRQFRLDRLRQRVSEMPLPGRLHRRDPQQSAHGLLRAGHVGEGCAAPRPALQADRRHALGLAVHHRRRKRRKARSPGLELRQRTARASRRKRSCAARAEAPFSSIQDLVDRVPELRKDELRKLSEIGALNFITAIAHASPRRALGFRTRHPPRRPAVCRQHRLDLQLRRSLP